MEDPVTYAWRGASRFARDSSIDGSLRDVSVTRAEYLEYGSSICDRRFSETF